MGGKGSGRKPEFPSVFEASAEMRIGSISSTLTPGQPDYNGFALHWTDCHLGGQRPWWRCPKCAKRSGVLYRCGDRWACRKCHRLGYTSTRESGNVHRQRWVRINKFKLKFRLPHDWDPFLHGRYVFPKRPKGMHRRAFDREVQEFWQAEAEFNRWFVGEAARFLKEAGARR